MASRGRGHCKFIVHSSLVDDFKKMYKQKLKELEKAYDQQVCLGAWVCRSSTREMDHSLY